MSLLLKNTNDCQNEIAFKSEVLYAGLHSALQSSKWILCKPLLQYIIQQSLTLLSYSQQRLLCMGCFVSDGNDVTIQLDTLINCCYLTIMICVSRIGCCTIAAGFQPGSEWPVSWVDALVDHWISACITQHPVQYFMLFLSQEDTLSFVLHVVMLTSGSRNGGNTAGFI